MGDPRSAYALLAELFDLPTPRVLHELTRRLATETQAVVQVWRARPGGLGVELSWPAQPDDGLDVVPAEQLDALPSVAASALIQDDLHTHGAVTLDVGPGRTVSDRHRQQLTETANCILLLWRHDDLSAAVHHQHRHTVRLAGELAESGRRLSTVRDLERRRVAVEMITLSTARFARLYRRVRHLDVDVSEGRAPEPAAVSRLRAVLDELIEDFRTMVRGIHSQVLQDRGPRAALTEVVAGLSRPAEITGTVPARVDPELATTLYNLTAAALQVLSDEDPQDRFTPEAEPLQVHLSHVDSELRVLIVGRSTVSVAGLRAALTVDTDRSAALGGGVQARAEDGVIHLRAWLPDRLEPAALAPAPVPSSLPVRVRELAIGLATRYGDSPGSARAWALVTRLDAPVRLGVQGLGMEESPTSQRRNAWLTSLALRLPDVELVPYPPLVDRADPNADPNDLPDAVLQAALDHPEEGADLRLLGAGLLLRSAPWAELPDLLATELVSRTVLLRSRSVLAALIVLLRQVPLAGTAGQRLQYELEELRSSAHELAEIEALAAVRTGELNLSPAQVRTAERLLGSAGVTVTERLGLPASARLEDLIRAAEDQMQYWRRLAEVAAVGRQYRQVCSVIVRTCEGLLAELIPVGLGVSPDTTVG